MENESLPEARAEEKQRPSIREENLPGHLQNQSIPKESAPLQEKSEKKEEGNEKDAQIKRALELLKGWEVFKQMAQKKAS
jgi:hypothetical protein